MKKEIFLNVSLLVLGLALSLFLAIGGDGYRIAAPGVLVARVLAAPRPYPNQMQSLGERLRVQIFVDWIFWFAVVYLLYFLIKRISRRSNGPLR